MTKKTFIKKLKEKLSILDSEEVKDIIEEYEATIDEKIKNGEEEKKAIADFGDIDELAKEILKAYKVNPKYTEDKKDTVDSFEDAIKKGATKLSEFTKGVVEDIKNNDGDFTVETIFEIILKVLALLLIIGVLRLPFWLLTGIGESLLDIFFFPLDKVLIVIWHLLMWVVYLAVCVLIAIAIFKNNLKSNQTVSKPKESIKKETVKETIKEKKEITESIQESKPLVKQDTHKVASVVTIIAKVFITIFITIPFILMSIGLSIALAFMVYFCFVGINLVGPICIVIAMLIMIGYLADVFGNIFKNKKRHFLVPIVISAVFLCLGITFTFIKAGDYRYYDHLDKAPFELHVESKEYTVTHPMEIELMHYAINLSKQVDDTLEDGKIRIEYRYYHEITDIYTHERKNKIEIDVHRNIHHNDRVILYQDVIDNLKKDKFYNYEDLFQVETIVYGNSKTLNLINF